VCVVREVRDLLVLVWPMDRGLRSPARRAGRVLFALVVPCFRRELSDDDTVPGPSGGRQRGVMMPAKTPK